VIEESARFFMSSAELNAKMSSGLSAAELNARMPSGLSAPELNARLISNFEQLAQMPRPTKRPREEAFEEPLRLFGKTEAPAADRLCTRTPRCGFPTSLAEFWVAPAAPAATEASGAKEPRTSGVSPLRSLGINDTFPKGEDFEQWW